MRRHHARMTDKIPKPSTESAPIGAVGAVVDWERIEIYYRAGILSLREIAEMHPNTNHVAIARKAKREDWPRDLAAKIKAKAEDLVTRQAVTPTVTAESTVTEKQVIDANAGAIVQVRLSHRKDIGRSRTLAMRLLEELEAQTAQVPELTQLGELMRNPDDKGMDKLNELYQKIISLPGRTKTMKDLGETLKTLIGLERQAFGLDTAPPANADPFTAMLHRIAQGNSSAFLPVQDDPAHDQD